MKRIGYSFHGLCEHVTTSSLVDSPDGFKGMRYKLVDELVTRGNKVIALQKQLEKEPYENLEYDDTGFPSLDILFLEWRWPNYKNSGPSIKENDLIRQVELLHMYHGQVPIIIYDTDFKMAKEDEELWSQAVIAESSINPGRIIKKRERLFHWFNSDINMCFGEETFQYGYLGNNYDRKDMFEKYFVKSSPDLRRIGIQTSVVGNWLSVSIEREYPADLIKKYPFISFIKRPLSYFQSLKYLESFLATTHITKKEYAARGAVSPRYMEAISCSVPALVPGEFVVPQILGKYWIANDHADVLNKVTLLKKMKRDDRFGVIGEQRQNLLKYGKFSVKEAAEFIESYA